MLTEAQARARKNPAPMKARGESGPSMLLGRSDAYSA